MQAIWLKNRAEVKQEEYNEFYKHISHDFLDPLETIHYKAEGTIEFTALLFIPSKNLLISITKVGNLVLLYT